MKKRNIFIFIIIVIVLIILSLFLLNKNDIKEENNELTDAVKIKEEYESLNKSYVKVSLKENNRFICVSNKKLSNILDNGAALIFIGSTTDNKARSIINILDYVNANAIYYIDKDNLTDKVKEKLSNYNKDFINNSIFIGVVNGDIIDYYIGEKEELDNNEKSKLKLKFDEINQKVSGDSCDIEEKEGC